MKKKPLSTEGTDTLEAVIIKLVDLGEGIAHADADGDGQIEKGEVFALLMEHGMDMVGIIRRSSDIVREAKDLQPAEYVDLVDAAVGALDHLTQEQRIWVRTTAIHAVGIGVQVMAAREVWVKPTA